MFLLFFACSGEAPAPAADDAGPCDLAAIDLPSTYAPAAPIELRIDDAGVPHLYAQSDADLMWAAGYQYATDRLYQLDWWRRASRGRLAEVHGEWAVDDDLAARAFGFGRHACESTTRVAEDRPDDYALIVAYVAGINRRVEQVLAGEVPLPYGFGPDEHDYAPEPFEVTDVVTIGRRINLGYSNTIEFDLLYGMFTRLVANYDDYPIFEPGPQRFIVADAVADGPSAPPAVEQVVADPAEVRATLAAARRLTEAWTLGGSNNWAVHGRHTENGRPLLANDPHAGFEDPSILMLLHLNSADAGGAFDVAGFAFPGVPGVQMGHNASLAWAATTNQADQTDLWAVSYSGDGLSLGGETVPLVREEETIRVRLADGTFEDRVFTIERAEGYGLVLPEELMPLPATVFGGEALLVNWVGFQPTDEIFAYLDLDRAGDLDAFEAAVDYQKVGIHNWIGATAEGWRYHTHGWVPDRGPVGARAAANTVLDGEDPSTFWTGDYLDPERFAHLDGTQDFVVTANNDPFGHTADNDPLDDDFYYASWYSPGFRADRIAGELERLVAEGPVTAEELAALQLDVHSPVADALVPVVVDAWAAVDGDESLADFRGRDDLAAAVAELDAWDGDMDADSATAALFRAYSAYLQEKTLEGDLSILFDAVEGSSPATTANLTAMVHARGIASILDGRGRWIALDALSDAIEWRAGRAAEAGKATLAWSDVHVASFDRWVGDDVTLPAPGDESTINVSECSWWDGDAPATVCDAGSGAIFRVVTHFDDDGVPVTRFNVPYGPDGDAEAWLRGAYDELAFRRADVEARTVETRTLE
ncbi:MAG: penicillin acylase family protein [Myxococcota bacterium]